MTGEGIEGFARGHGAELVELPRSVLRNAQWVLFDAMRHSLEEYGGVGEFAWIDSDVVVARGATDIWGEYDGELTVCPNRDALGEDLLGKLGLPMGMENLSTGVVRWGAVAAKRVIDWFDANVDLIPRVRANRTGDVGDQEVLLMALHGTGQGVERFHPKMHVAGMRPPLRTAFKHKGGGRKIPHIKRFLAMNKELESRQVSK